MVKDFTKISPKPDRATRENEAKTCLRTTAWALKKMYQQRNTGASRIEYRFAIELFYFIYHHYSMKS